MIETATGTGKTFNVSDYIAQEIDRLTSQKRKIIFITHLKKNLPFSELKQRLIAYDKVEYDKERFYMFKAIWMPFKTIMLLVWVILRQCFRVLILIR